MQNYKLFVSTFPFNIKPTSNVEFTDRAVNDLEVNQEVQLGTYEEADPITETSVNSSMVQKVHQSANMERFTLNRAIDREYPLTTINWSTSNAVNHQLATYSFPDVLFAQPFIAEKIADFRLFRAAIRISFRVTSNRFLYGKFMVSYEPIPATDPFNGDLANVYNASGSPHIIVSAAAGETAVFDVPFINNKRLLDLQDFNPTEMGIFRVVVLNPLIDVNGGTDTAQVFVTAQFIDAELLLPHDSSSAAAIAKSSVKGESFVVQSKRGAEATRKCEKGVISGFLEDTAAITAGLSSVPFVGPYADLFTALAKPTASVMKILGLSKPTTVDTASVGKINPFSDIVAGKGIDTCVKMAMDPENQISTTPIVGGIDADEMDLKYIAGTPQLVRIVNFIPATPTQQIATTSPFDDNLCHVDFLSRNFAYISGSYKFKIYITASLFQAIRGVFWLADSTGATDWANCYHKIVDIQGDTEVEFTVPYCGAPVAETTLKTDVFGVNFTILTWSQPDAAINAPIALNVYKAGASDFKFGALQEKSFSTQSNPRADFKDAFEPIHHSMVGYEHQNLLFGEEYTTLREIIHRYSAVKEQTLSVTSSYQSSGNLSAGVFSGLEMFGLMFRFYRGSVRMKFVNDIQSVQQCAYVFDSATNVNAAYYGSAISSLTNPLLEMEVPWYSNMLFESTTRATDATLGVQRNSGVTPFLFKAAGDDFSFHFLRAPPIGIFNSVMPISTGVKGFNAYIQAV